MKKFQSLDFWKNPRFILALILAIFFLKGVFVATLFPLFAGQDETKHFNSVEFLSEPRPIAWPVNNNVEKNIEGMQGGNYTEEILRTAQAINFDEMIKGDLYNTSSFPEGYSGKNEAEINSSKWNRYNENYPVNRAGESLYHKIASFIEKAFGSQSILVRYFLIRIFSVLLGTLTVLFSYFIAKNIGFSAKHSLLLAAIVAFQPRFSIYSAAINYDPLLILMFTIFTLGGVLALKYGLNWKNLTLMIASIYLGVQTKPTATFLLIVFAILLAYFAYEKVKKMNKKLRYFSFFISFFVVMFLVIFLKRYIPKDSYGLFGNIISSVSEYLSGSLTMGKFTLSSRTYWGALSWVNNWFLDKATNIIWTIEAFSAMGIALFFIPKKYLLVILNLSRKIYNRLANYIRKEKASNDQLLISAEKPDFLPEKKYIVFLLVMITALQLGIRTADWLTYSEIGTPGRYFMPNLATHIILVFTGIGMLIEVMSSRGGSAKGREYFEKALLIGLILMMTFMMYIIFDVIILRYYL